MSNKNYCDGCLKTFVNDKIEFDLKNGFFLLCPECFGFVKNKILEMEKNEILQREIDMHDTAKA